MGTVIAGERYVVDEKGVRQAVLIDIEEWNRVVRELAMHRQRMEQDVDLAPLLEPSFAFWNNAEDAVYDTL
jgi:PHD/YefM family antitoxin component YafN of YafNO toxin-antitoxin module